MLAENASRPGRLSSRDSVGRKVRPRVARGARSQVIAHTRAPVIEMPAHRIASSRQMGGQRIRDSHSALDLAQQERSAIRGCGTAVEPGAIFEPIER